jgi:hypothetical protein
MSTKAGLVATHARDPVLARNATDEFRLSSAGAEFPAVRAKRDLIVYAEMRGPRVMRD